MKTYVVIGGACFVISYIWINALYAIRSPAAFLRARWTARRSLSPDTPHAEVRRVGVMYAVMGASATFLFVTIMVRMFGGDLFRSADPDSQPLKGMLERHAFILLWWLATLDWLASGIFALASPVRWSRTPWLGIRRLESRPALARLYGAVFVAGGVCWAFLGVRMARRMW
jgi:hypothetical protein